MRVFFLRASLVGLVGLLHAGAAWAQASADAERQPSDSAEPARATSSSVGPSGRGASSDVPAATTSEPVAAPADLMDERSAVQHAHKPPAQGPIVGADEPATPAPLPRGARYAELCLSASRMLATGHVPEGLSEIGRAKRERAAAAAALCLEADAYLLSGRFVDARASYAGCEQAARTGTDAHHLSRALLGLARVLDASAANLSLRREGYARVAAEAIDPLARESAASVLRAIDRVLAQTEVSDQVRAR